MPKSPGSVLPRVKGLRYKGSCYRYKVSSPAQPAWWGRGGYIKEHKKTRHPRSGDRVFYIYIARGDAARHMLGGREVASRYPRSAQRDEGMSEGCFPDAPGWDWQHPPTHMVMFEGLLQLLLWAMGGCIKGLLHLSHQQKEYPWLRTPRRTRRKTRAGRSRRRRTRSDSFSRSGNHCNPCQ